MIYYTDKDTIAAIATAQGAGGIGVIRISGEASSPILLKMFTSKGRLDHNDSPRKSSHQHSLTPYKLEHGWVYDNDGKILDEVLAVFMPNPRTFTAEDIVEIHCHGGTAVLNTVLATILNHGARLAERGEFTRRAYLNGRLDLSQAEAVAEMISAPTKEAVFLARNKLEGRLGLELSKMRTTLDWLRSRLYMSIDFPDESQEESHAGGLSDQEFQIRLSELKSDAHALIGSFNRAKLWREGAMAVLAGEVNVGKSSLLNALLGRKRAIVSNIPGTTRDFIEESIDLDGIPLRIVDTAGLRDTVDFIESEGINLAKSLYKDADLILRVIDTPALLNSLCIDPSDICWPALEEKVLSPALLSGNSSIVPDYFANSDIAQSNIVFIFNKADLLPSTSFPETFLGLPCISFSSLTSEGITKLTSLLRTLLIKQSSASGDTNFETESAPTLRQKIKLEGVVAELEALEEEYMVEIPAELLSVRLDQVAVFLQDIIGTSGTEDILGQVFSTFCIGK